MTIERDIVIATGPAAGGIQEHHSYLDWPAIIGGILLASAISLLLLTFGSAVGLSFANFRTYNGVSPVWAAIAAASWLLWVQISSFMCGGYLTGRMRRRFHDATEHESDVRDGSHGLLVWAGALVIGGIIAVSGIGSAANAIGSIVGTATNAASNVAQGTAANPQVANAASSLDPTGYFVDELYRVPPGATVPQGTNPGDVRAETARILAASATTGVSADDKTYLAALVSRQTGLPQDQASARVDQVLKSVDDAKAKAADAAETARKAAVLAAFLAAASLLVSAVGAYWAAMKGGKHRDEGTEFTGMFGRY